MTSTVDRIEHVLLPLISDRRFRRELAEDIARAIPSPTDNARSALDDAELLDSLTEHERRVFDLGYRNGYATGRENRFRALPTEDPKPKPGTIPTADCYCGDRSLPTPHPGQIGHRDFVPKPISEGPGS